MSSKNCKFPSPLQEKNCPGNLSDISLLSFPAGAQATDKNNPGNCSLMQVVPEEPALCGKFLATASALRLSALSFRNLLIIHSFLEVYQSVDTSERDKFNYFISP